MSLTIKKIDDDSIGVSGPLTFDTAKIAYDQTVKLIGITKNVSVDLKEVDHCDSAGLAYLTSILRFAKQQKAQVTFTNLPKQMIDLAKVSELNSILGF